MTEHIRPYDLRLRAEDGLILRREVVPRDQFGSEREAYVNVETGMLWCELDELGPEFMRLYAL